MANQINSNIFRVAKTGWKSSYLAKKSYDTAIFTRRDIEIRAFILKFFKNKLDVLNCNLTFFEKSIHISISYSQRFQNHAFKKSCIQKQCFRKQYRKCFKFKSKINAYNQTSITVKRLPVIESLHPVFMAFLKSISIFTKKRLDIFLIVQKLDHQSKFLKINSVLILRKFKHDVFYNDGIRLIFACGTSQHSATELAHYAANHLSKQKRHKRFLKFLKESLALTKKSKFCSFKGVKIQIKGRLNGQTRSVTQLISVGDIVAATSISETIEHDSSIAHSPNGSIGVKIWIHKKN